MLNSWLLARSLLWLLLFHPQANIKSFHQGVFPHQLFYLKSIVAWLSKIKIARCRREGNAVLVQIVHALRQPAPIVGGQRQLVLRNRHPRAVGRLYTQLQPDVVVIIFFRVPENNIQAVRRCRIGNGKRKAWLETAFPLVSGNGCRFFVQVSGGAIE